MLSRCKLCCFILSTGLVLVPLCVESNEDNKDIFSLSLEELMQVKVYTASQETEMAAQSASTISVITAQQLKEWGITNLQDAISLLPGINKNETYLGQVTQTFRGVNPGLFNNKSLYLINGHPSYESLFGSTLLDYIPIEIIERIEVVRSPASVLYGTNASSGVINIITRQGAENNSAVTVRGGSYSHKYGSVMHHSENLSMAASVQRDAGYPYTGTVDEFANPVDMDYRYDLQNIFIDAYANNWRINAAVFQRDKAMYGRVPWVWQNGIFETSAAYLDVNKMVPLGNAELNLWLRYDMSDKNIHSGAIPFPASSSECAMYNISTAPAGFCDNTRLDTASTVINTVQRYSLEVQYKEQMTQQLSTIIGATAETQKSDPILIIYDDDGSLNQAANANNQDTQTTALYTQIKYQASEDTLYIAGLRSENNSEAGGSGLLPRFGVSHQLKKDTYLKIMYSKAFRNPGFIEKYANLSNVLMGNENLKRETIHTYEIGIDSQLNNNNKLQMTVYTLSLENEILSFPASTGSATEYRNGEGKEMQGIEAEWISILNSQFEFILNAAYVTGKDKSLNEDNAPYIANTLANTVLTYHLMDNWSISLTGQYIGDKEVVSAITQARTTIESYTLFNLTSVYNKQQHEFKLILNNITDEKYSYPESERRIINDVPGGPGFTGYAQYQYSF